MSGRNFDRSRKWEGALGRTRACCNEIVDQSLGEAKAMSLHERHSRYVEDC